MPHAHPHLEFLGVAAACPGQVSQIGPEPVPASTQWQVGCPSARTRPRPGSCPLTGVGTEAPTGLSVPATAFALHAKPSPPAAPFPAFTPPSLPRRVTTPCTRPLLTAFKADGLMGSHGRKCGGSRRISWSLRREREVGHCEPGAGHGLAGVGDEARWGQAGRWGHKRGRPGGGAQSMPVLDTYCPGGTTRLQRTWPSPKDTGQQHPQSTSLPFMGWPVCQNALLTRDVKNSGCPLPPPLQDPCRCVKKPLSPIPVS